MMFRANNLNVFIAPGATDLRKSIDGLSILVAHQMELSVFSGNLFGFCNRRKTTIKLLYWDRNGFCLWTKRLEKDKFRWPDGKATFVTLSQQEFSWLLDGLPIQQNQAHRSLHFKSVS